MKNILLITLIFIFTTANSFSQFIIVEKENGESQSYNLADINNIKFDAQSLNKLSERFSYSKMVLHHSGLVEEVSIADIDSVTFNSTNTIIFFSISGSQSQFNISDLDSITFKEVTDSTIYITYDGNSVNITNPLQSSGVAISVSDADVIVTSTSGISDVNYVLSGSTSDGMFKIYSDKKFNLYLNNINITNNDGPAVNNQSSKKLTLNVVDGTVNNLSDGLTYAAPPDSEDQDAALFSEGQIIFTGSGSLIITATGTDQHAIKSDDYIQINNGNIVINSSAKDGISVNNGFFMYGGSVNITSNGDGIDGNESVVEIYDGAVTILNSSDDKSALKADSLILISGGTINITVQGDQSKGINSNRLVDISGGTLHINTSGGVILETSGSGYDPSYCTAIKADSLIIIDSSNIIISATGIAGRGISCDGIINVISGTVNITSSGNGGTYTNSTGQLEAFTGNSINADGRIFIYDGEVTLTNTGTGGKGISCDANLTFGSSNTQPIINVTTTGASITISNGNYAEAKAISADSLITIENGSLTISSADDGIKAKTYFEMNGGVLNIAQSKEGIEAPNIFVNGGDVSVNSSDDGFNATYGDGGEFDDGSNLTFNDGYIYVNSTQGDAIDSNGDVNFNGGVIVVHGPQSSPEVGLDYNGTCKVTGGFLVISGTNSNLTQAPGTSSTQHSVLFKTTTSINAGTLFHIEDEAGNNLLTFAPNRRYYSVVFSDSALTNGSYYKVYTGGSCTGTLHNGLYTGGTYSGGTLKKTFTLTSIVQIITF